MFIELEYSRWLIENRMFSRQKITKLENNKAFFNPAHIVSLVETEKYGEKVTVMVTVNNHFNIKETIEDILDLIAKAKNVECCQK